MFIKYLKIFRDKTIKIQRPIALVIRKETFKKVNNIPTEVWKGSDIVRKSALEMIIKKLPVDTFYVTNTGFTSREFLQSKLKKLKENEFNDFLCIGGMGHAISVATGIAVTKKKKKIVCIDGDGSMLMHLGSYRNASKLENLLVLLFNNGCHESVGGNLTDFKTLSFSELAKNIGFKKSFTIDKNDKLISKISSLKSFSGSIFIEIRCNPMKTNNLIRPKITMQHLKRKILTNLRN